MFENRKKPNRLVSGCGSSIESLTIRNPQAIDSAVSSGAIFQISLVFLHIQRVLSRRIVHNSTSLMKIVLYDASDGAREAEDKS
jgi:hypothetical protein